jgi:hypothetical protein
MSQIPCSFCTSSNSPDAKFCNQCGSPLGLKPCPACEAVNEAAALACHQCGAALDVPSVEQITSSMEQSTAAEAAALTEQASPVAEDAPIHIPESFADRLERDAGLHAFERVEPRIAHSADRDAPEAITPYVRSTPVRPRGRAWRAPIALAVLAAIAGAGYYAYKRDVPGLDRLAAFALAGRNSEAPASAESRSSESRAAAPASDAPAADVPSKTQQPVEASTSTTPSVTAGNDAKPAADANPASAALVSVQPGAPGQPQIDAASTQLGASSTKPKARPSAAPSRNDDEAARQRVDTAGRSRRQADADAIATQRLIARDLGTAIGPPANAPAAPLDRDAAETQRLIERDLGPFLHRNDRSLRGGTYPAIN